MGLLRGVFCRQTLRNEFIDTTLNVKLNLIVDVVLIEAIERFSKRGNGREMFIFCSQIDFADPNFFQFTG